MKPVVDFFAMRDFKTDGEDRLSHGRVDTFRHGCATSYDFEISQDKTLGDLKVVTLCALSILEIVLVWELVGSLMLTVTFKIKLKQMGKVITNFQMTHFMTKMTNH